MSSIQFADGALKFFSLLVMNNPLCSFFVILEEAKRYVQIFNEIGRLEQLQTYYNNCHKVRVIC